MNKYAEQNGKIILEALVKTMAFEGKTYKVIFEALTQKNREFSDSDIDFAKRQIDEQIANYQLANIERSKARDNMIIGLVLVVVGSAFHLVDYLSRSNGIILALLFISFGFRLAYNGYKLNQQPLEDFIPKKRKMFKNRNK